MGALPAVLDDCSDLRPIPQAIPRRWDTLFDIPLRSDAPQRLQDEDLYPKPYYSMGPEWTDYRELKPLGRPLWPYELPRRRIELNIPVVYEAPIRRKEGEEEVYDYAQGLPPSSYHLTQDYRSDPHPDYVRVGNLNNEQHPLTSRSPAVLGRDDLRIDPDSQF